MARESRHLKICDIPEPVDEQKLLEHFRSYGRVQKLELVKDEPGAVVVSFMEMRTASKALGAELSVNGHPVKASYCEPGSAGVSSTVIQIHDSDESVLHSRSSGPGQQPESRRSSGQHVGIGQKGHGRSTNTGGWQEGGGYECGSSSGGGGFREPLGRSNGLDGGSQPRRPLSRLSGCGGSFHGDRGGRKRSNSSGSPKTGGGLSSSPANNRRSSPSRSRSQSPCGSPASRSLGGSRYLIDSRHHLRDDGGRGSGGGCSQREQATIVVRNLPRRSTDSSIKDGLFFTYKKHAKVVSVKVIGSGSDRYALVTFRRSQDAVKAISATNGEMFFGSRIMVELAPLGLDGDDNERRPLEKDIDQYHAKSSRTLYVGNLENRITPEQLKHIFEQFGDVLDVDIKNRETPAPFAFVQFADIVSVVKAIHAMEQDGYIGKNKIKVGFGKPLPSPMVWLDELPSHVTEEYLTRKMKFYGTVTDVLIDKAVRQAVVTYDSIEAAQLAVTDMKGRTIGGRKVQIDFCSRELHDVFVDRMFRCSRSQRGSAAPSGINPLCAGVSLAPSSVASASAGRKSTLEYYGHDGFYDSSGLRSNYMQRSGGVRSFDCGAPMSASTRDYMGDYNGGQQDGFGSRRARGRSMSPSRCLMGRYQHRHENDDVGRSGPSQKLRLARSSRSPPSRYGALTASRDSSLDKTRQRRLADDASNSKGGPKRPRTPPAQPDVKPGRNQRYQAGQDARRPRDLSSSSDDESDSSSSATTSSSRSALKAGSPIRSEGRSKAPKNAPAAPCAPVDASTKAKDDGEAGFSSNAVNAGKDPSPEMNKLQQERERLLQVIEHLAVGDEKGKATGECSTAAAPSPQPTLVKPKLEDVFDLDWVKAAAEQEQQKSRRRSSTQMDTEGTRRSGSVSFDYDDQSEQQQAQEETGDRPQQDQDGQFKKRKKPFQPRAGSRNAQDGETEGDESSALIKSMDEADQSGEKKQDGMGDDASSRISTGNAQKGPQESTAKKSTSARSSVSKTKLIPMEAECTTLVDPRSNPPNITRPRDLPLPNFYSKRSITRHHHHYHSHHEPVAAAGPDKHGTYRTTTAVGGTVATVKTEPTAITTETTSTSPRIRQISIGQQAEHAPSSHPIQNMDCVSRQASLRQRNSSASEQLSPLISSGGDFSATDSDGALMSPPGCGGDGAMHPRTWVRPTVDIFGEALSPPSAGHGGPTEGSTGSSRRSFEERIRALDAKFSALDQMIKGAKERPQQPIRQMSAASAAAASAATIDYSKYKVVKKPSLCGVPSSPSTPVAPPSGLCRVSAFDYDAQRLLGNVPPSTTSVTRTSDPPARTDAPAPTTKAVCNLSSIASPPAADTSKAGVRPLSITIPPAPLSSSSSSAPTPSGATPLSPTGVPLQGILKNKPRTPTGEGAQPAFQQHQDPRTAARREPLKSPTTPFLELPPPSGTVQSPAKPSAGKTVGGMLAGRSATLDNATKPSGTQPPQRTAPSETKSDKTLGSRALDRSNSTSSVYPASNTKPTDGTQKNISTLGEHLRKMSMPVAASIGQVIQPKKEIRKKETEELFQSESHSEQDAHRNTSQVTKTIKKPKVQDKGAPGMEKQGAGKEKKTESRPGGDNKKEQRPLVRVEKKMSVGNAKVEKEKEKEKERKLSSKDKGHQEPQQRHILDKEKEKQKSAPMQSHKRDPKEKLDAQAKSSVGSSEKSASASSSTKSQRSKPPLKQKPKKTQDESGEENSGQKASGRSSSSDEGSGDESDDGRRREKRLAKEWREVLASAGLAEEPAGLSMYDRVKRRSSAAHTDPWKQGKSSKGHKASRSSGASANSKMDKFLLLKEKRAKHNQKLVRVRTGSTDSSDEEDEDNRANTPALLASSPSESQSESSEDETKRSRVEEAQRKKKVAKMLQQKKRNEPMEMETGSKSKMVTEKARDKEKEKKLRLAIADVFSSEGSSDSEDETVGRKKKRNSASGKDSDREKGSVRATHSPKATDKKVWKADESKKKASGSLEKRPNSDSPSKRALGKPTKPTTGEGRAVVLEKQKTPVKGDKKGQKKVEDTSGQQCQRATESEEERRERKKRKMEQRETAEKSQMLTAEKSADSVSSRDWSPKLDKEKEGKVGVKRLLSDDDAVQNEPQPTKKMKKASSPAASPNSSSSNLSSAAGASGTASTSSSLVTKAAMKRVETPAVATSPPPPQSQPPRLLTKAAMKAVDLKKQPDLVENEMSGGGPGVELSADLVEALRRSREEEQMEEGTTKPVEVGTREEVVEASDRTVDAEENERQAALAAVRAIEKDLRSKEDGELAALLQPTHPTGNEQQEELAQKKESRAQWQADASALDDKTKPLSVDVDANVHETLSEQKSDVSHVDEIIDDVVHGYVEIDAEKLIKMTNAANKAAAAAVAAAAAQDTQKQQQVSDQSMGGGLPSFPPSTVAVSTPYQHQQTPCAQMGASPHIGPPQLTFSSASDQPADAALRHHQFQQQQSAEISSRFGVSNSQSFSHLSTGVLPVTVGTETFGGFHTQQPQPQPQPQPQQPQQPPPGVGSASGPIQNFTSVTGQQPSLHLPFQSTPSTVAMAPRPQSQSQARSAVVPHHQFIPTTPVTPSATQIPFTSLGQAGPSPTLPSYAVAAAAQQHYAAFLELQQKQAAWASANLLQQPTVAVGGAVTTAGSRPMASSSGASSSSVTEHREQRAPVPVNAHNAHSTPTQPGVPRLLNTYPIVWQGCLVLKNDSVLVQMHYVDGAQQLIKRSMPDTEEGSNFAVLRISQRMRLENQQLEGVHRRMQLPEEHCVLVALPCGQNRVHIAEQGNILQSAFINYLTQKQAAGIVNITQPGSNQTSHVVHIFPPCEFSDHYLTGSASDFLRSIRDHRTSYLFIVITTVVQVM